MNRQNNTDIQLPEAFEKRMRKMLGDDGYQEYLASFERKRAAGVRVNPLVISDAEFLSLHLFRTEPVPFAEHGYYYELPEEGAPQEERPGKHPAHEAGMYYMQEPSAMIVAALSGARPKERILDLCAAPGGKSTQLAGMMNGQGLLVSNEINEGRARILSQNMERMGVRNAVVTNESAEKLAERFPSFFDRIIVDAPCSGEGMFRKEEQALSMWSEENVRVCAGRQQEILRHAAVMLRDGGTLVYSTCTFAPLEDEISTALFLAEHPEFNLADLPGQLGEKMEQWGLSAGNPDWCDIGASPETIQKIRDTRSEVRKTIRLWPQRLRGEGHFLAVMEKHSFGESAFAAAARAESGSFPGAGGAALPDETRAAAPRGKRRKGTGGRKDSGNNNALQSALQLWNGFATEYLTEEASGALQDSSGAAMLYGDDLYLAPEDALTQGLRVLRPGLHLGTVKKDRFEPAHALAMALRPVQVRQSIDFPDDTARARAFLRGESVPCDSLLKGWVLITTGGVSMGWAKAAGGMLKNHYPKGLRRPY